MRRKFTFGMMVLSTSTMILSISPALIDLSARSDSSTSFDRRCTSPSGASSAACTGTAIPSASTAARLAATRPIKRRFIPGSSSIQGGGTPSQVRLQAIVRRPVLRPCVPQVYECKRVQRNGPCTSLLWLGGQHAVVPVLQVRLARRFGCALAAHLQENVAGEAVF